MRLLAAILGTAIMPAVVQGEWTPPANPDPQQILQDARSDTKALLYDDALAKFVWFHHHALEHNRALSGVRLSFALGYWHELAKQHPPALAAMKHERDDARQKVGDRQNPRESFADFAALNRELGETRQTRDLFVEVESKDSKLAQQIFSLAKPALIEAKEYQLCGRYLAPQRDLQSEAQLLKLHRDRAQQNPLLMNFAVRRFTHEVSTLVALLVINERKDEAVPIADSAKAELDDADFREALEAALAGKLPAPWP
jgi:hypothetical protein